MRLALIVVFISGLFAGDIQPVPSPVGMHNKTKALRTCKVPVELAILPPAIDVDYKSCVNNYYMPVKQIAAKKLVKNGFVGKKDKLLSVKIAQGFVRAYLFEYKGAKTRKTLLCEENMNSCYVVSKHLLHKERKK